jgi:hypothetical protein
MPALTQFTNYELKIEDMKKHLIYFWITTGIIILFEGVMPLLTFNTELAKEGIRHLGYPAYFGAMLIVFKVAGTIALGLPRVPGRIKEWAYAGFGFDFIAACVSHWAVDGFGVQAVFPLLFLALLIVSYINYHRLRDASPKQQSYALGSALKTGIV